MNKNAEVLVVLGSKSDEEVMSGCLKTLAQFGVEFEYQICSAHRNPEKTSALAKEAENRGIKVIIAAAGMAAALPGVIAANTKLPVIGVPMSGSTLGGLDALLSIVQMPAGVPVAAMAIGSHGARNAALMAVRILSLSDTALADKLSHYIQDLAKG